ncbi:hypothetical protein HanIR_Chr03g0119291 [Helianthus annuus]|nr:hypothetical protein HanIR_Chr03g0119291 [Helianthus annuus]
MVLFAIGWVRRFYRGWVLQLLRVFAFLEGVVSWLGSVVLWVGHGIRVNCLFDCYKIWVLFEEVAVGRMLDWKPCLLIFFDM